MTMFRTLFLTVGAASLLGVTAAKADVLTLDDPFYSDREDTILGERFDPYQAEGVKTGAFMIYPKMDVGVGWSSDIFALSDVPADQGLEAFEEESDFYGFFRPSVRGVSLWSRHALSFSAYGEAYQHSRFSTEAIANFGADVDVQFDLTRSTALFGGVSGEALHESRQADNSSFLYEEPLAYTRTNAYVGMAQHWGRLRGLARIDRTRYDYQDVDILVSDNPNIPSRGGDQDFRDRTATSYQLRAGIAVNPDIEIFLRGTYNTQDYDLDVGDVEFVSWSVDRDSEGYVLSAGAEFDFTDLIRGRAIFGYFEQDYDSAAVTDLDGLDLDLLVEWTPRRSTGLTLTHRRKASEAAVFAIGGYVSTLTQLRIDQEVRRNLTAFAYGQYEELEYPDFIDARTLERYGAGAGVRYYFNRQLSAQLEYEYDTQDVSSPIYEGGFESNFDVHQVLLTATLER